MSQQKSDGILATLNADKNDDYLMGGDVKNTDY